MQRHEQTAVPAGSMGETHPAFYVVATGGSGTSAQGRLERVADSHLFPPFDRREGRYRAGHGDHRAPELGAAGWRRHDIRPSAFGACVENARDEDGQDGARLPQVGNSSVTRSLPPFSATNSYIWPRGTSRSYLSPNF